MERYLDTFSSAEGNSCGLGMALSQDESITDYIQPLSHQLGDVLTNKVSSLVSYILRIDGS
jgi:hypothetical protein